MVRNLHSIITDLKNPDVRLEDNSTYCVDDRGIGILYANSISNISPKDSFGIMSSRIPDLNPEATKHFKKRNQVYTRIFFEEALGLLKIRKYNAEELIVESLSNINNDKKISPESVEYLVLQLSEQGSYERIGKTVKSVAKTFYNLASKRRMQNINFAKEYDSIYRALKNE